MFQIVICLLYALPIFMGFALLDEFIELEGLIGYLGTASEAVEKRHVEFAKAQSGARGDFEDRAAMEGRMVGYFRSLSGASFSWTTLFEALERTVPDGVRLIRIKIKPESVVQIFLEGEASSLDEVTDLLRRLYSLERFSNPHLSRHSREETSAGPIIRFTLDVQYLPVWEARP